jgi:endonuclease YncB( thermonuclease family)
VSSRSSYGRPVAIVTVGGRDLGEVMIGAGLAIPQPQFLKGDPDRAARYSAAFATAQRRRVGALVGEWIPPAQWRRGRRLACER